MRAGHRGQRASVFSDAGNWRLIPVATLMCSFELVLIAINTFRYATVVWEVISGIALVFIGVCMGSVSVIVFISEDDES